MASGSQSLYKGSDEVHTQNCDVCMSNGKTSAAISFCKICCEHLCQFCDMAHRGSKATRDHTILVGSNIPSVSTRKQPTLPFMFCDTHRTSLLDTYCTTHEQVICPACKMTNHTTCKTGDVSRHSAKIDVGKELKKVANLLRDLTNKYDNFTKNRHTDKSTVMSQIQNCFSNLKQFRNDINDQLDELEKKMSSEIRQIEEMLKKEIDGHVTLADDISQQVGDLDKSLSECEKTQKNDVMFVGLKKASSRAGEYGLIIDKIEKETYPIDIRFQPNGVLSDMIQQLQSLGTVDNNRPMHSSSNQTSILNMSLMEKQEINLNSRSVGACTFMSDGHLVLGCFNDGLKLFDEDLRFKSKLSLHSEDVSAINDTDVIVTQSELQQLQIVTVFPKMVVKKTLEIDTICEGVDVCGEKIYVTCHDDLDNGEVRVLNMDGEELKRLGVDNGKCMFTQPNYIKVNRDGSKVFVSEADSDIVTCLNSQGHVIYQYSDRDLEKALGLYVDGEDNLLVCGYTSNKIHVIRNDGRQAKMFSNEDGINFPVCISYRQSDGCLVVVFNEENDNATLMIYSTR